MSSETVHLKCPACSGELTAIVNNGLLNDDQFDSIKAGDFYCRSCPANGRGHLNYCYWWSSELKSEATND